jgi:hypothetical protein
MLIWCKKENAVFYQEGPHYKFGTKVTYMQGKDV